MMNTVLYVKNQEFLSGVIQLPNEDNKRWLNDVVDWLKLDNNTVEYRLIKSRD